MKLTERDLDRHIAFKTSRPLKQRLWDSAFAIALGIVAAELLYRAL